MSTTHDDALLSIQGLNAWYGTAQAVFDATLDVKAGEIVGLLGRNGAGKSSTFNSIMNIDVRRTGDIRFEGRSTMRLRTDAIARLGISWVPEDRRIFSNLTVTENLQLARFASRGGEVATVDELVDSFPLLAPLLKRKGDQLSGGEQQMVAVARALVPKPRLLLLDEPTEGLAPLIVEGLASAIAALPRDFGVTILVAEQNLPFIKELTSRVFVLETGRVVHAGPTAQFAADDELQHRFLSVSVQV